MGDKDLQKKKKKTENKKFPIRNMEHVEKGLSFLCFSLFSDLFSFF